jgi:hypothetical protein
VQRLQLRLLRTVRQGRRVVLFLRADGSGTVTVRGPRPAGKPLARKALRRAGTIKLTLSLSTRGRMPITVQLVRAQGARAVLRLRT